MSEDRNQNADLHNTDQSAQNAQEPQPEPAPADPSRREFLKQAALGAAGAIGAKELAVGGAGVAALGVGAYIAAKWGGTPHDEFYVPVEENKKPMDQRNLVFTMVKSKKLQEKHPERVAKYGGVEFIEQARHFENGPVRDEPGYSQLDRALQHATWHASEQLAPSAQFALPNMGICSWDQSDVAPTQYKFKTKEEASNAIKSAARVVNAFRCGITKRDHRWDFDPMYDVLEDREISWDEFPFEPKTVIVMLVDMDYEALRTAPYWTAESTIGEGYTMMHKVAGQVAKFIRGLGYHAVAAGNDLGMSVPYAIAAGLGEGARNNQLIAPHVGSRVRICKVYTDFEFVEYDKPRSFGITDFCMNCKRCADACPGEALTWDKEPTWGPTYEGAEDPDYAWNANPGIMKFHGDAKKCFKFWIDNDSSCGVCITVCPFNKPDFWHHRLIDGVNPALPGPIHLLMREMDIWFGYGTTYDKADVKNFWASGKNMTDSSEPA